MRIALFPQVRDRTVTLDGDNMLQHVANRNVKPTCVHWKINRGRPVSEWRQVVGFPAYKISDEGEIRAVADGAKHAEMTA